MPTKDTKVTEENRMRLRNEIFIFLFSFLFVFSVSFVGVFCSRTPTTPSPPARPQVVVQGPITQDTAWESGKDYIVRGTIEVGENAVLTIQKDVHVILTADSLGNKGKLYVEGGIVADGVDSTSRIVFGPDESDLNGDESWGVELDNGEPASVFKQCRFFHCKYGIKLNQTRFIVYDCSFEECQQGVNFSKCDSVFIVRSHFSGNVSGIKMELSQGVTDSSITVSGNRFTNCTELGVEINNQSRALVSDNYFNDCGTGLNCAYSSQVELIYNSFNNCFYGIRFQSVCGGEVKKNGIIGGNIGIYLTYSSNPVLRMNNLLNCDAYKVKVYQSNAAMITDAEHNWWGTDSKDDIQLGIRDANDTGEDDLSGIVDFEPWETSIIEDCGARY